MSNIPKAREELHRLMKELEKDDPPKDYTIATIRWAMLFMFKEEHPAGVKAPVSEDFDGEVTREKVEETFQQLLGFNISESNRSFVMSLYEDFDEYNALTTAQWKALKRLHNRITKNLGVR